jgi:hypothetical protein
MDITIHYIDHTFTLIYFVVKFVHLKVKHSGENIATELLACFSDLRDGQRVQQHQRRAVPDVQYFRSASV